MNAFCEISKVECHPPSLRKSLNLCKRALDASFAACIVVSLVSFTLFNRFGMRLEGFGKPYPLCSALAFMSQPTAVAFTVPCDAELSTFTLADVRGYMGSQRMEASQVPATAIASLREIPET